MYQYHIVFQRVKQREDVHSHMMQFVTASKRNEREWTQRKKIVDEHWRETRFGILSCCISANQIPDLVARCDSCDSIAARIKCVFDE